MPERRATGARIWIERAIIIVGSILVALAVWSLGLDFPELAIVVAIGLGFVVFAARAADARSWSTAGQRIGLTLGSLASLFWLFALASLVGEIRSGIDGPFYYTFAAGNAVALIGVVVALRRRVVGGVAILFGAVLTLAAALFSPFGATSAYASLAGRLLGQVVFALPAIAVGVFLCVGGRSSREPERELTFGAWLRALTGV